MTARHSPRLLLALLGLVAVVGALQLLGPRAEPTAAEPPATPAPSATPPPKVGDTVHGKNWAYRVEAVERPTAIGRSEPHGAWVAVRLTLENTAKENFPINEHDFELRDAGGVTYRTTSDTTAVRLYLEANKLTGLGDRFPPGVPIKTAVVYDVNPAAAGLKLWLVQERAAVDLGG